MEQEQIVLCVANSYTRKFYINDKFASLPEGIKEELQIISVLFTEDVGGILEFIFDEDGALYLRTECAEDDFGYDEIGSVLKVKQIQQERRELLESLETYYRVFFKGGALE